MLTVSECPVTIRPRRPFWREDGCWMALSGWAMPSNQCHSMSPFSPFDLAAACWTFLRWRLPAEARLRWARLCCRDEGHAVVTAEFHTRIGVYRLDECGRCGAFLGWFRPDGSRVERNQSWCAEGHHLNVVFCQGADGRYRCVECGALEGAVIAGERDALV